MNAIPKHFLRNIIADCRSDYVFLYEINSLSMGGSKADKMINRYLVRVAIKCINNGSCDLFKTEDGITFNAVESIEAQLIVNNPLSWIYDPAALPRYALLARV